MNKVEHLQTLLHPLITRSNLYPLIESPVQQYYRNKSTNAIGLNSKKEIACGQMNKQGVIVQSYTKNLCESRLTKQVCKCLKKFIGYYQNVLPLTSNTTYNGFWRTVTVRESQNKDYLLLFCFCNYLQYETHWKNIKNHLIDFFYRNISDYTLIQVFHQRCTQRKTCDFNDPLYQDLHVRLLREKIHDKTYIMYPNIFFQVNTHTTKILFDIIRNMLSCVASTKNKRKVLFDMCCGTGVYGIVLHDLFDKIVGIDYNSRNIDIARQNLLYNDVTNMSLVCDKMENVMDSLFTNYKHDELYIFVVNPTRSGIPSSVLRAILTYKKYIHQLVYVSCNPHTLMRDLQLLQIEKQHVKKIIPLDQFPHTLHYEVIVHLDFFNTKKSS